MEFKIGAGLACVGLAVAIASWLIPPDKLNYEIRLLLIIIAILFFIGGLSVLIHAAWRYFAKPTKETAVDSEFIPWNTQHALTADQWKILGQRVRSYASSDSNVKVLFANIKHKPLAERLKSVFEANNWHTNMTNVPLEASRHEYLEGIEVSGHNVDFVEALAGALRDVGLKGIKTSIERLGFDQSNPGWNWAQHKIKIVIGHSELPGQLPDKLGSKTRSGLISLAVVLAVGGAVLIAYAFIQNKQSPITTETVDPATNVEITRTIPSPDLFKPGETAKIHVFLANKGPLSARDVSFAYVAAIRSSLITKSQEDEMFNELLKDHKGSPPMDMAVGNEGYRTIQTPILSQKESDDLTSENSRLYVFGFIRYRDKNGQQKREFCRWLQPPLTWHLCDGGHNRMISGDTPY